MQTLTWDIFSVARKSANDRLYDLFEDNFQSLGENLERVQKELQSNTRKTDKGFEQINGRIQKIEKKVFPDEPTKVSELPPWYRDTKIIKLFTYIALAFLILVAAAVGFDLTGLL